MKRFHIHVAVDNMEENIRFYSTVFGVPPTVSKPDYAKWMLDDPRINFAISQRGLTPGLDHLGLQVESDAALTTLREQVGQAEIALIDQRSATCCYARSDKYWITDPQGIAWETFHTLDSVPVYGEPRPKASAEQGSCCSPAAVTIKSGESAEPAQKAACC